LSAVDFEKNDIKDCILMQIMKVCFDLPSSFVPNEIVIYDTTGKAVRVVKYDTINSLKISDLTAGIYFIKFKG
jgi:hypothetical protein